MNEKELEKRVKELEAELAKRRFGLVWDKEKNVEEAVAICSNKLPILKHEIEKDIVTDENATNHLLIEGDNFHSLSALLYTHTGLIDFIYIDPPYNTGNNDFIYNDRFVDKLDGYRHSKWLNMMEKRLVLSKKLLSEDGVIFISIDDNEMAQLKLLCDKVFGEENFEAFIWKKKGGAGNTEKIIGCLTEYILCYFKKKRPGIFNYKAMERVYKHQDEKGGYNLEGIEKTNSGTYERPTMLFPIIDPKTGTEFYPSSGMRWTIGKVGVEEAIKNDKLFFDYKKKKVYYIKRAEDYQESKNVYYNLLTDCGSLATAKDEIDDILGNREAFDTPKPVKLMCKLLEIGSKKNSIVLDFFAGTGTTAQAVLEMNARDGGNRRFIICTNNEGNICSDITYPRIRNVILGYKPKISKLDTVIFEKELSFNDLTRDNDELVDEVYKVLEDNKDKYDSITKKIVDGSLVITGTKKFDGFRDGYGGNLRYYSIDFVDNSSSQDQLKFNITEKCLDTLSLKNDCYKPVRIDESFAVFCSDTNKEAVGIYFDLIPLKRQEFVEEMNKFSGTKHIYVFSLNETADLEGLEKIDNYIIEPIPFKLLEQYKKVIKLARGIE